MPSIARTKTKRTPKAKAALPRRTEDEVLIDDAFTDLCRLAARLQKRFLVEDDTMLTRSMVAACFHLRVIAVLLESAHSTLPAAETAQRRLISFVGVDRYPFLRASAKAVQ